MADVRANAMAILSSLPPEPIHPISSVPLLKRSSAIRSTKPPSRSNSSTIGLVPHLHKRQYSVDSHFSCDTKYDIKGERGDTPFERGYDDGTKRSIQRHKDGDFGLPHPPSSRLSSLNFGRQSTRPSERIKATRASVRVKDTDTK